jgi:hypothetical protein
MHSHEKIPKIFRPPEKSHVQHEWKKFHLMNTTKNNTGEYRPFPQHAAFGGVAYWSSAYADGSIEASETLVSEGGMHS